MSDSGLRIGPVDGEVLEAGTVIKVRGEQTGGALAVVETMLPARTLISEHVHANDVWIYVLAGEVGVLVGEQIAKGGPGTWLLKPRNVPHAKWNAAAVPARVMEVLTPAGSEGYFIEGQSASDQAAFDEMAARYGIRFFRDSPWNERLRNQFGLL
jgi:quercetin dioxygenase-like cupin family protein